MDWLLQWAAEEENEVSSQTRCYYPLKLRDNLVNGLSQDMRWDCGNYYLFLCLMTIFFCKKIKITHSQKFILQKFLQIKYSMVKFYKSNYL